MAVDAKLVKSVSRQLSNAGDKEKKRKREAVLEVKQIGMVTP